jgi:uncharacterized membrane protein YedE/YeeE
LLFVGAWLGFVLSRAGFSSWDEVHKMFGLQSFRLTLAFAGSVGILVVVWWAVAKLRKPHWTPRRFHPGTIPGALLFGAGWALSGACPSVALVQLGEGKFAAVVTLTGIFFGNYGYSWLHERRFRWHTGSCNDD